MPVQHTLFGRPCGLRMPPRRFQLLSVFIISAVVLLGLYGPPSSSDLPTYEEVAEAVKNPHLPSLQDVPTPHNPFGPSAHKPQLQPNTNGTSSSWALESFKWRNPFGSSITLDENRAVLPPLKERPPIYTFYEKSKKQDKATSEAESRLILAWRRAWWAQGFKPQVLSRAEAMAHPQYQLVQRMKLDSKVEFELMRLLAWGYIGSGILANWLALPMAPYDNPMLSFLRRKEYPTLSRIDTLQAGVLFGEGTAVNDAIKKIIDNKLFKNVTANKDKITELGKKPGGLVVNLLSKEIKADSKANGIAYYSTDTISTTYKSLGEKLTNTTQVEGLDILANLINSHLHLTFQESFSDGLALLKPLPEHTTALLYEAIDIARNLTQCPASPIPFSCPPNRPRCKPCDPSKPLKLELSRFYRNSTKTYTIGAVPHPYTLNLLHYTRDTLDENFLRRSAGRDQWIFEMTKEFLGEEHSGADRAIHFKDAVAAPHSTPNTLWLTVERESQVDLDWIFGFNLPQNASPNGNPSTADDKAKITVFPRPTPPKPLPGVEVPEEKWIKNEEHRLKKAREALNSKDMRMLKVIEMVEQWNLADTEAWKFARAWSARRRVERQKWEEEERKYAGSEQKSGLRPGGNGGGRWTDKLR